ncbi:MAG TPA: hypothetical protein VHS99_10970 [Chloroflexota bacterium]|nr:hypothetical protein [Chloroflexota bacterium]
MTETDLRRAGGTAALVQAGLSVTMAAIALAWLPRIDTALPGTVAAVGEARGPLVVVELLKVISSLAGAVLVLAFDQLLARVARAGTVRLATAAGLASATFLLASGAIGSTSLSGAWGAAGIAALAMPPLALLALVLGLPVTVWLGVVLLSG